MTKLWVGLALLALLPSLILGQSDDRYVIKRDVTFFQGSCRSGQVGMAPTSGQTYVCVSGQWRRNDLPACTPSAPSGTCDQMSMCLHRPTMILYGCSSTNVWTAITGGGSTPVPSDGAYNYSQAFTSQTSVNLNHSLGTENVLVSCYDGSDIQIYPDTVDIAAADPWDITVTFEVAQTGRCVVNGSGNGTTGGGGDPGTGGFTDLREDGAARVNDAEYIDFLSGFDVTSLGAVSLDYAEKPVNLSSSEVSGTLAIARGGTGSTAFTSNTCVRYDGTRLVSAATDCGGSTPGGFCGDADNDCKADVAENVDCTTCVSLISEVSGLLPVASGGTGISAPSPDRVMVGNATGTAWGQSALPDCDSSANSKLLYDAQTDTFNCSVDQTGPGGVTAQGPEGAIQFYEGGILGSNATLLWTEASTVFKAPKIEASTMFRGQGAFARFDIDRDDTYDIELGKSTPYSFIGFNYSGSYITWGGPGFMALRQNGYIWFDFDGDATQDTDTGATSDFCIRGNGIDANCDNQVDFQPNPAQYDVMIGNASLSYSNASIPDCDGTGSALNYSRGTPIGNFSCQTISASASGLANKLDVGLDGTNVQLEADGTTLDMDPDADGVLEARVNADGSIETFGAADESGGMGSNGKLIFSADDDNNGTGEGMDWDFDGDGSYELSAAGTGTLTMLTGAVIPGKCASTTPAATITADDCNVLPLGAGAVGIITINTCNAANLGRFLYVLCGSATTTLDDAGGNLQLGGDRLCAANRVLTLVCDGTNWLEVAWAAN